MVEAGSMTTAKATQQSLPTPHSAWDLTIDTKDACVAEYEGAACGQQAGDLELRARGPVIEFLSRRIWIRQFLSCPTAKHFHYMPLAQDAH